MYILIELWWLCWLKCANEDLVFMILENNKYEKHWNTQFNGKYWHQNHRTIGIPKSKWIACVRYIYLWRKGDGFEFPCALLCSVKSVSTPFDSNTFTCEESSLNAMQWNTPLWFQVLFFLFTILQWVSNADTTKRLSIHSNSVFWYGNVKFHFFYENMHTIEMELCEWKRE